MKHSACTAADLDEILTWYAVHNGIRMSAPAPDRPDVDLDTEQVGPLAIARSRVAQDLTVVAASTDAYVLAVLEAGTVRVDEAKRHWTLTPAQAGLYRPPPMPRRNTIAAHTDMVYLQFRRPDMERHLEDLIEDYLPGPIDFSPALPTRDNPIWLHLFRVFTQVFERSNSAVHLPLVHEPLREALVHAVLNAAEHPYRSLLRHPAAPARPRHVRIVVDAIRAEPDHAYTVAALARIGGTSVRSLQQGFRQHVGMSPITYLRRVRLTRAHHELRRGEATVAEAAHRWGFTHLGRFAAAYTEVYGVSPSTTRTARRLSPPR